MIEIVPGLRTLILKDIHDRIVRIEFTTCSVAWLASVSLLNIVVVESNDPISHFWIVRIVVAPVVAV